MDNDDRFSEFALARMSAANKSKPSAIRDASNMRFAAYGGMREVADTANSRPEMSDFQRKKKY